MVSYKRKIQVNVLDTTLNGLISSILQYHLPKGFTNAVIFILSELTANIKDHAHAGKCNIELKNTAKHFLLALRDDGIGIRNSYLRNNIFAKDDRSAVELALSGLSTKKRNERAYGLFSIRKITEALSGSMNIRTGKASMICKKNQISFTSLKKNIPGVQVTVVIKAQRINIYDYIS